jgi:hypothetical protein
MLNTDLPQIMGVEMPPPPVGLSPPVFQEGPFTQWLLVQQSSHFLVNVNLQLSQILSPQ